MRILGLAFVGLFCLGIQCGQKPLCGPEVIGQPFELIEDEFGNLTLPPPTDANGLIPVYQALADLQAIGSYDAWHPLQMVEDIQRGAAGILGCRLK
jgi:hypothetical protein